MDTDVETAAAVASNSYVTLGDVQQLLDNFERGDASPPLDRGHLDANGHYADEPEYDPDAEVGDPDWQNGCWSRDLHQSYGAQRFHTPNNSSSMMSPAPASLQPRSLLNPQPTYYGPGDEYEQLLAQETAANGGHAY
jgi:hypothetical protein